MKYSWKNSATQIVLAISAGLFLASCGGETKTETAEEVKKPNIIYILADDMGYADIGAYGQDKIETPNLDAMAKSGIKFLNHYTGSTVCAPSRSALLTGLHTGHTPIRGNKEYQPEGQQAMPDSVFTIGKMMQDAGYITGTFGKWGLGFVGTTGDPLNQGMDYFYGYNCQRQAHRYYPDYLWENDKKVILDGNGWQHKQTYAQDVIHEKTLAFIDENKDKPFFMYVPLVAPHAELATPDTATVNKYRKRYGSEKPYIGKTGADYGDDLVIGMYQSQEYPRATYATMVETIDRYVGEIMAKLEENGLAENTIIMFASDNGPHREGGNDPDFFDSNNGFRGYKRDLYDGGIRTAFMVKWPGKIKAGAQTDHVSAFWDLLPTLADIIDYENLPSVDGVSFLPTLLGESTQPQHDFLYWEFVEQGGKQAVRKGDWKGVKLKVRDNKNAPLELYNLKNDPGETNNVADQHPEMVQELENLIQSSHTTNPIFPLFKNEGEEDKDLFLVK
ncbi:arylsulfatase [Echinicola pacifica]|uniref:Arylsulfatase n=1 Tax=Echinicola pacifica TaxID=346377 RepID=A0A918PJQ6_9BACT|nr:arylsulfatase [Echinicola pacifica]GGZ13218.1 arylsulfatase [Echinicola pacifica]